MKKIFLQIGATRDGQNPYCAVAQREGYFTVLAEMAEFVDYQSQCLELPFDLILRISKPENPQQVMQAYFNAGLLEHPQVVLAGFEAYNPCAGRVREMLAASDEHHSFIPLDKYAQRMALSKAQTGVAQPEFRFFASVLSIRDARDALIYPCVITPVDGGGGLGVWLVKSAHELDKTVDKLVNTLNYGGRRFTGYIVERWLPGVEYSLQGVVCDGVAHALTCCQKLTEQVKSADGAISFYESGHVAESAQQLPAAFQSLMQTCCTTFDYRQGAFHIDFILLDNVPYFLEMGFRLSGMGVVSLVNGITGQDWAEVTFHLEEGKPFHGLPPDAQAQALGQLRMRQPAQLAAAELWVRSHPQSKVLPPLKLPPVSAARHSPLYADVTRHAGILGTLRLAAADTEQILAVFNAIVATNTLPRQEDLPCAG
ncbi:ATP-grasp domain-containing protein [Erwinia sp. V71]|uniref:ATP-grasp domain-containing protein n=1 Tax=Erwinia sp. V71 TaxID=3369424 RepID=UPI003F5EF90A